MDRKTCDVEKSDCRRKDAEMSKERLMGIAVLVAVIGVVFILLSIFVPMSAVQAAGLSSLGIPLLIFGLVMFGIIMASYVKRT